jgi:predicted metal-dependent HD superfamily phosphohydrolase
MAKHANPEFKVLDVVPEIQAREERIMSEAMGHVLAAIRPLRSDSTRMRVLAAASCMHGADGGEAEAKWFLDAARSIKGSRCARCGRART